MNTELKPINFSNSLHIVVGVAVLLFLVYVVLFWIFNRHRELTETVKKQVSRFAPVFLIFAPPIITYGFVCGLISFIFGYFGLLFFKNQITNPEGFLNLIFKVEEYLSGIGMCYLWLRLVRWIGLKEPWYWFILISHGLVAGYREGFIGRRPDGSIFGGPTVTDHFVVLDALMPFWALLIYWITCRNVSVPTSRNFINR